VLERNSWRVVFAAPAKRAPVEIDLDRKLLMSKAAMLHDCDSLTGEMVVGQNLADPAWILIRDLICDRSGIFHSEIKFRFLAGRTHRRMKPACVHPPNIWSFSQCMRPARPK
jgi:hypothetical protein